jgi:hypothetical protein
MTTNIFSPLSFVAVLDPGSGMGKNQDPGSGIRDKHPGSATLEKMLGRIPTLFQWLRLCKPLQFCVPFCIVMPTHGEKGGWGEFCREEGGNRDPGSEIRDG